jgi:hypothetical protein
MSALPKSVKDLKEAKYNPRTITGARKEALKNSMSSFGDLSGVVFNTRTKTLISGHQRMSTTQGLPSKIVQNKHTDKHGTVAIGHIEVTTKQGVLRIPYRAVDWDLTKEKAANIAANAHGGQFDKEKLKKVLASIEKSKAFDVELTGLDALTLKSLRVKDEDVPQGKGAGGGFKEITVDEMESETEHVCPKCKYRF